MKDGPMKDDSIHSSSSASTSSKKSKKNKNKKNEQEAVKPMATMAETMSFVFDSGAVDNDNGHRHHRHRILLIFAIGTMAAILNGLVHPILAYLFSTSFSDISAAASQGLSQVRELAFMFLIVGVYALVCATIQTYCFETAAHHGAHNFRVQWFQALLRQDAAFFGMFYVVGIYDVIPPFVFHAGFETLEYNSTQLLTTLSFFPFTLF
jgi:ATP-binding cassette, subfamily B (MDR/TAP), member 1